MILVITKENEKLISEVLQENNIEDFQILTSVNNLYNFTSNELRSLNNFNQLVIDLSSITDNENQIIDTIVTLQTIYKTLRITILALGYSEGNTLLSKLFSESIFNFVTAKDYFLQKEELIKCLTVGNTYSDSIQFRYKDNNKEIPKNKVIIKKEYTKRNDSVTIGIVGTQAHIGVTTQAFLICKFLNSIGVNACYVQSNNKKDVEKILQINNIADSKEMITYNNIDIFKDTIDTQKWGYDFYVYDYGDIENLNTDAFIGNDVKIVISGTKEWDFLNLYKVFDKLNKAKENLNYIFNFTAKENEKNILNGLKEFKKNIFFSEYTPNPFAEDKNQMIYHRILKEYIIEKTNQVEILEKNKFSIKNMFFKRK